MAIDPSNIDFSNAPRNSEGMEVNETTTQDPTPEPEPPPGSN